MTAPDLIVVETPAEVGAAFTTRVGGASRDPWESLNVAETVGDAPNLVIENRRRIAAALGFEAERMVSNRQVHGSAVRFVGPDPGYAEEADALVTGVPGHVLTVLGADCLPVLAWRRDGSFVGAAHAGWRGISSGVVGALVRRMGHGSELDVAVGPGIGPCCYPVDHSVRWIFASQFGEGVVIDEAVDLPAAARIAAIEAGVDPDRVQVVGECTSCDAERFFSYRRDGQVTGRQAGLIWRRGDANEADWGM